MANQLGKKCVKVLTHPRTSALAEIAYATHGLHDATTVATAVVYFGIFLVSMAHLIWVHIEH